MKKILIVMTVVFLTVSFLASCASSSTASIASNGNVSSATSVTPNNTTSSKTSTSKKTSTNVIPSSSSTKQSTPTTSSSATPSTSSTTNIVPTETTKSQVEPTTTSSQVVQTTTSTSQIVPTTSSTTETQPSTTTSTIKEDVYFDVVFKNYDDTVLDTQRVKEGEIPSYSKPNPTKSSDDNYKYTFSGWSPSLSAINSNTIYVAQYNMIKIFNVTFDANEGVFDDSNKVVINAEDGSKVSSPEYPTKISYKFTGWSKTKNGNDLWDFSTDIVRNDIILYAKWEEEQARIISFENASINNDKIYMVVDEDVEYVSLSTMVITSKNSLWKLYYDRLGQTEIPTKIASSSGNSLYIGDNIFYIVVSSIDGIYTNVYELTIHRSHIVKITFIDEDYINLKTEYVDSGYEYIIDFIPEFEGYTFDSWLLNRYKVTSFIPTDNTELEVLKNPNKYLLTLDVNGGDALAITDFEVKYCKYFDLPVVSREGYAFLGWEYSGVLYTDETGFGIKTYNFSHDVTLTANWVINSYKVSLTKSDNNAGVVTGDSNIEYNSNATITAATNNGYTFVGWYKDNEKITSELTYTFVMPAENVTYEACWIETPVVLKRNTTAGGTVGFVGIRIVGQDISIRATTNSGYTFVGWYKDNEKITSELTYTFEMSEENATYEARWIKVSLSRNNTSAGIVGGLTGRYTSGENATITATTNTGYTFAGWYKDGEKITTKLSYTFEMPEEDVTYEARWIKVSLSRNNTSAGIVGGLTGRYISGENATITATTNSGYTFVGWYKDNEKITSELTYTFLMPTESVTYEARWIETPVVLTKNNDGGFVELVGERIVGKNVVISSTTRTGYTFDGWYKDNEKITSELTYTFVMPIEIVTYEAHWTANNNTLYKVEHYQQNIEDDDYTLYDTEELHGTTDTLSNANAKEYVGFNKPLVTQVNVSGDGSTVLKLYYVRKTFNITLTGNVEMTNSLSGMGTYKFGKELTIEAKTTNGNYTFLGWYNNNEKIASNLLYTFVISLEDITYEARWVLNPITLTKNINLGGLVRFSGQRIIGEDITIVSTINAGYTFDGLYKDNVLVTRELSYNVTMTLEEVTYEARWIETPVVLNKNIENAGLVSFSDNRIVGEITTINATTNVGYTFDGWYLGDELISLELSYSFIMPLENITYLAKWRANKYRITIDNQLEGVEVYGIESGQEYDYGSKKSLRATNIPSGYTIKWIRSDDKIAISSNYKFTVPAYDISIRLTLIANKLYERMEDKLYFGTYPQTLISAAELIAALNYKAGTLPTSYNTYNWTDYNYYISGNIASYMYFQDIDYDNDGDYDYRGVYFTQYRPCEYCTGSTVNTTYQYDNGYDTNTVYWFKYESIEWNILKEENGKALLVANLILDSQDYYQSVSTSTFNHNGGKGYANNYVLSYIRKWLNETFYNTAFNAQQKTIIKTTVVDNGASTLKDDATNYFCENTSDKIFLLSYQETSNTYYSTNSERQAQGTDYAKSQGLLTYSTTGMSSWWLRSPSNSAKNVQVVSSGFIISQYVSFICNGVRPACYIVL